MDHDVLQLGKENKRKHRKLYPTEIVASFEYQADFSRCNSCAGVGVAMQR
jgi:hypothetical protein